MAVTRPRSNVCERRGWSKKFSIEGMLHTAIDRRNARGTDVTRDDGNVCYRIVWSGHVSHLNFGGHQPYLWNG